MPHFPAAHYEFALEVPVTGPQPILFQDSGCISVDKVKHRATDVADRMPAPEASSFQLDACQDLS
jgi:hypothetical protein